MLDFHQAYASSSYEPAGRLIPLFAASETVNIRPLTRALSAIAAARGETVMMIDAQGGALMQEAGIIYNKTLGDVIARGAELQDALYVTSNEHFTATAAGDADLDAILGSLAALSLTYDWVFVATEPGCSPAHIRLASASDVSLIHYSTQSDSFMRAYWMVDAIRARDPLFDALFIGHGPSEDVRETGTLLRETVREHLGAPPPAPWAADETGMAEHLLLSIGALAAKRAVA